MFNFNQILHQQCNIANKSPNFNEMCQRLQKLRKFSELTRKHENTIGNF